MSQLSLASGQGNESDSLAEDPEDLGETRKGLSTEVCGVMVELHAEASGGIF
jgi:hypothetical protein